MLFLVAAFVIGPERLPEYAGWATLGPAGAPVRRRRQGASTRTGEEARRSTGRRSTCKYDPRRIVRRRCSTTCRRRPDPHPHARRRPRAHGGGRDGRAATAAAAKAGVGVAGDPGLERCAAPFDGKKPRA